MIEIELEAAGQPAGPEQIHLFAEHQQRDLAAGNRARLFGLNTVGLKRHKFPEATMAALKQAHRILFRSHLTLHQAIDRVKAEVPPLPEVQHLLDFLKGSKRGICR